MRSRMVIVRLSEEERRYEKEKEEKGERENARISRITKKEESINAEGKEDK